MRSELRKLGRVNLVINITLVSVFLAVLLNILLAEVFAHELNLKESLLRSGMIPLFIAPFVSWYLVGVLFDLDRLEKEKSRLATYDDLTGLFNRRAFLQSCRSLHALSLRNHTSYCVLTIDFDHFKTINDKYGHACGDKVLSEFGALSAKISRNSDVLGRMGGEEFAFFLPKTDIQQAEEFAHRLREHISSKIVVYENKVIPYSISIGIATNGQAEKLPLETVLKQADHALYAAKRNGRDQVIVFDQTVQILPSLI